MKKVQASQTHDVGRDGRGEESVEEEVEEVVAEVVEAEDESSLGSDVAAVAGVVLTVEATFVGSEGVVVDGVGVTSVTCVEDEVEAVAVEAVVEVAGAVGAMGAGRTVCVGRFVSHISHLLLLGIFL